MSESTAFQPAEPDRVLTGVLSRYSPALLEQMSRKIDPARPIGKASRLASSIAELLSDPNIARRLVAKLSDDERLALRALALVPDVMYRATTLRGLTRMLGVHDPDAFCVRLLRQGLLLAHSPVIGVITNYEEVVLHRDSFAYLTSLLPAAASFARGSQSKSTMKLPTSSAVAHEREADGLEWPARFAAIWQRAAKNPVRVTSGRTIFKRDRERLAADPVLSSAIADSVWPLGISVEAFIGHSVDGGVLTPNELDDRLDATCVADGHELFRDAAAKLFDRCLITGFLLTEYAAITPDKSSASGAALSIPLLFWLESLAEGCWLAIDELEEGLLRAADSDARRRPAAAEGDSVKPSLLQAHVEALYQLGFVRVGKREGDNAVVCRLSERGRRFLSAEPAQTPAAVTLPQCLYVQPNFEVIAYRQGLSAELIWTLSRMLDWSKLGAACEFKLTADSIHRGLESGMSVDEMIDVLTQCSGRALPSAVTEAIRSWNTRRERITIYPAGTLLEFANHEVLEAALAAWPAGAEVPIAVTDRLLLVEDDAAVPYSRFKMTGARDYRRTPEPCVGVEPDGVTLSVDLSRSDLFVDAEITRFADEIPPPPGHVPTHRRYRVSLESMRGALESGMNARLLEQWFIERARAEVPPAVSLLLHASGRDAAATWSVGEHTVLRAPSERLLSGLQQHPATRDFLGERLGPTMVIVPAESKEKLTAALAELALPITESDGEPRNDRSPRPGRPSRADRTIKRRGS